MMRQLELIHWIDSHSAGGTWLEPSRAPEELTASHMRILTLGWVIFEDEDRLIVSGSHSEDWEQVGEVLCIAKVAVTARNRVMDPIRKTIMDEDGHDTSDALLSVVAP